MKTIVECCCGSITDVNIASSLKVDRIELNCALELGGLTPSFGLLLEAKSSTTVPLMCMVRPRGAGFNFSEQEKEQMFIDAEMLLQLGADGIVFGFLNKNNTVDIKNTRQMVELIHEYGKQAVFHKAFDKCANQSKALKTLIDLKVDRILTSGEDSSNVNCQKIKALLKSSNKQIEILPGGGINSNNVIDIIKSTNTKQVHMSCKGNEFDNGEYLAVNYNELRKTINLIKKSK